MGRANRPGEPLRLTRQLSRAGKQNLAAHLVVGLALLLSQSLRIMAFHGGRIILTCEWRDSGEGGVDE